MFCSWCAVVSCEPKAAAADGTGGVALNTVLIPGRHIVSIEVHPDSWKPAPEWTPPNQTATATATATASTATTAPPADSGITITPATATATATPAAAN